jgi:hypothetical protein
LDDVSAQDSKEKRLHSGSLLQTTASVDASCIVSQGGVPEWLRQAEWAKKHREFA